MPYLTAEQLKPELGHPQEQVTWGKGVFPSEARVEELIAANSRTIDGLCCGRYTVPFSPVPEDIRQICLGLCLGDLLPAISNSEQQHGRAKSERKWAMDRLQLIHDHQYSLPGVDESSPVSSGAPVVVSTPATPRMFSMRDPH